MFGKLLTISRNTFTESIRQPVYMVLLMLFALLFVFGTQMAAYTLDDDNVMLRDMLLSMLLGAGVMLSAFTATRVLTDELEQRTVLTVVSKPVPRPVFVAGKFLGVAAALVLAMWILSIVMLLMVRHEVMQTASDQFDGPVLLLGFGGTLLALAIATLGNYFYKWIFTASFVRAWAITLTLGFAVVLMIDKQWRFQSPTTDIDGQLLIAMLLCIEGVLIFCAAAIAASTRLKLVMTLVLMFGLFFLSVWAGPVGRSIDQKLAVPEGRGLLYVLGTDAGVDVKAMYLFSEVMQSIVPNLQYLWAADAMTQGHEIPLYHVGLLSLYSLLFVVALVSLAVVLFQTREVG